MKRLTLHQEGKRRVEEDKDDRRGIKERMNTEVDLVSIRREVGRGEGRRARLENTVRFKESRPPPTDTQVSA